jgi:DnaJ domain
MQRCVRAVSAESNTGEQKDSVERAARLATRVMLSGDETAARRLRDEYLSLAVDSAPETARYLSAISVLLDHGAPVEESQELRGEHLRWFNAILNAVEGHWRIGEAAPEEKWKTIEDVRAEQQRRKYGLPPKMEDKARKKEDDPHAVLGVSKGASRADIKAAYRKLALQLHPDVNDSADATAVFAAVTQAYAKLNGNAADADGGDADGPIDTWPEFQRTQKTPSSGRAARGAAAGASGAAPSAEPQVGDIVEYPIPPSDPDYDASGPRTHGIGLLVSRNKDRGDAKRLSDSTRALCEVEPLRQLEPASKVWIADELGVNVYPTIETLLVVDRAGVSYKKGTDHWVISAPLSPWCSGPPHVEEVIL